MEGMYDFRFSSGRIAENLKTSVQTIEMKGVIYPVTINVKNIDIRLTDETGFILNEKLNEGEYFTITNKTINKFYVSEETTPDKFSLEQNYPNPFNPITRIDFSVPINSGIVRLTVYNSLGEKISELVNEELSSGYHQYQWNSNNEASGIYFYELKTDKFVAVRKMILLK